MHSTGTKTIVILGNGGGAVHAAAAARKTGFSGRIIMVSDTVGAAFNPMLAPYYLKGALSWKSCFPFGMEFHRKFDIEIHFGSAVEYLDPHEKKVVLVSGERLSYDKCLIATGARPLIPPISGIENCSSIFPLRSADSTLADQ